MKTLHLICLVLVLAGSLAAQQTVFNVPSADVLDRGKVYAELDVTYQHSSGVATFTPRAVVGLGRNLEAGINLNGLTTLGKQSLTPAPTVKWKIYKDGKNRWSWLAGDDVFIPAQNRTYNLGNYFWSEAARTWNSGTRLTFGIYHSTANVFAAKQKFGGQFAFEQTLTPRLTFATDWYTGDCSVCFVTPGIVVKMSKKLTWYASYQVGNHDSTRGNHQLLMEAGWNFN